MEQGSALIGFDLELLRILIPQWGTRAQDRHHVHKRPLQLLPVQSQRLRQVLLSPGR